MWEGYDKVAKALGSFELVIKLTRVDHSLYRLDTDLENFRQLSTFIGTIIEGHSFAPWELTWYRKDT